MPWLMGESKTLFDQIIKFWVYFKIGHRKCCPPCFLYYFGMRGILECQVCCMHFDTMKNRRQSSWINEESTFLFFKKP